LIVAPLWRDNTGMLLGDAGKLAEKRPARMPSHLAGGSTMIVLKWLIGLMLVSYLGGLAVLYLKQRALIFPIPETVRTAPGSIGLAAAKEQVLTTADNEKVIVWHVPAQPGHPLVLFFPGNGDVLARRVDRFRALASDGTGLVALSYRGYAGSTGHPSEQGLLLDAAAAYDFAAAQTSADQIIVWGASLGTGVAVALAAKRPVGKLVLESPYTSTADVAAEKFWFVPVRWLMTDQFRSDQHIAGVTAPLLVMHGVRDRTVPIAFGERLFALANGPKQFVPFPEGQHDDLDRYGAIETFRHFAAPRSG
jgi:uncharacterized protein